MRLLVVSHSCVLDVNQRIYAEVQARGHELAIVMPRQWRHDYAKRPISPERLRSYRGVIVAQRSALRGSIPLHAYLGSLARVINRHRPDVLYIEEEPYSVAAFQWARVARAHSIPYAFYSAQNIRKRYPLPFSATERWVFRNSALALPITSSVATVLRSKGYERPLEVVPLWVDNDNFRPAPVDEMLRRELRLNLPTVGFAGRVVAEKGVHTLLEAFQRLRSRTNAQLLVIGSGPLADTCRRSRGVTVVEGVPHADIPRYLRLMHVLAVPSLTTANWQEQFGRVVIEAMAVGVPVVGSDSGEIPELIRSTGGGLVVPEGRAAELSDALQQLLTDSEERLRLASTGSRSVMEQFAVGVVAERLTVALSKLPPRPPNPSSSARRIPSG